MAGENPILPAYVRSLTLQDHDCYLNKLTLTDKIRLADPMLMDVRSDRITSGWVTHIYRET